MNTTKKRLVHAVTGVECIGFTSDDEPIWPLFGFADDDSDDDDDEDEDDEDDKSKKGDGDEKVTLTKAEHDKLMQQRSAARKEAGNRRRWLQEHGIDPHTGKKVGAEDDDEEEEDDSSKKTKKGAVDKSTVKAAVKKAEAAIELKYKPVVSALAARVALDTSGVLPEFRDLIAAQLDVDDIEVDDDGNVVGLDDQIDELKQKHPKCFAKKGTRNNDGNGGRGSSGGAKDLDGGPKNIGKNSDKKTWAERMAEQVAGRGK